MFKWKRARDLTPEELVALLREYERKNGPVPITTWGSIFKETAKAKENKTGPYETRGGAA